MKLKLVVKKKILYNKILKFFLIIGFTYCSGYAFGNVGLWQLKIIMSLIILFSAIAWNVEKPLNDGYIVKVKSKIFNWYYGLLLFPMLLSILAYFPDTLHAFLSNAIYTITIIFIFTAAYILIKKIPVEKISNEFVNVMVFFSAVSSFMYLVPPVAKFFSVGEFYTANGVHYINGILWFTLIGKDACIGPFWEGGLFGSYIVLALVCIIFYKPKLQGVKLSILLLAAYLTHSTATYILLLLVAVLFILHYSDRTFNKCIGVLLIISIILVLFYSDALLSALSKLNPEVFGKLIDISSKTRLSRLNSPIVNLLVFAKNPLLGNGFAGAGDIYYLLANNLGYFIDAQTSTSTFMMAVCGICGVAYTAIPLIQIMRNKRYNIFSRLIYALIIIAILNKEPHYALAMTYIILMISVRQGEIGSIRNERL